MVRIQIQYWWKEVLSFFSYIFLSPCRAGTIVLRESRKNSFLFLPKVHYSYSLTFTGLAKICLKGNVLFSFGAPIKTLSTSHSAVGLPYFLSASLIELFYRAPSFLPPSNFLCWKECIMLDTSDRLTILLFN